MATSSSSLSHRQARAAMSTRRSTPTKWWKAIALAVIGGMPVTALAKGPIGTSGGPDVTNIWGCILFEHEDFAGSATDVTQGTRQRYVGDSWNDKISSIACRSGCVLTTYEDRDFGGDWHFWRGNMAYVGDAWNDRISSLTADCSEAKQQSQPEQDSSTVLVPQPSTGPSPFEPSPPPTPVNPVDKQGVFEKPGTGVGDVLRETKP